MQQRPLQLPLSCFMFLGQVEDVRCSGVVLGVCCRCQVHLCLEVLNVARNEKSLMSKKYYWEIHGYGKLLFF